MARLRVCGSWLVGVVTIFALALNNSRTRAEEDGDWGDRGHRPVYQRHASEWKDRGRHDRGFRRSQRVPPKVESAWFQRPYPYHLDYYKMRYGGSYAPYFGNLYGPPQVVTAPPYYGPYYGDFGYGGGMGNGPYPLSGEQLPGQPPVMPGGEVTE